MLIKVGDRAELTAAEQEFVECLRLYPTTGLALIGVRIGHNGSARHINAVVWTPQGMTVFEVIGLRSEQSGVLDVQTPGAWKIGKSTADVDLVAGVDPCDRLENAVCEVGRALQRSLLDPGPIWGAIALVTFRNAVVRPGRSQLRFGRDVVVCNATAPTEMRTYLENFAPGAPRWTADRVRHSAAALGVDDFTREDLFAAGFAEALPQPGDPAKPPRVERLPEPTRRQSTAGWTVVVTAVLGMLVVLAMIGSGLAVDPAGGRSSIPSSTTTTDPAPAPYTPVPCWPLQPTC